MTDPNNDSSGPAVITPLESGYIRAAIVMALPAINWIIYATNLDEVLHITKVTTNQAYQFVVALIAVAGIVRVVLKRIKEGKDPRSTAPQIVMSKPDPPAVIDAQMVRDAEEAQRIGQRLAEPVDEFAQIDVKSNEGPHVPPVTIDAAEAMREVDALAKKYTGK